MKKILLSSSLALLLFACNNKKGKSNQSIGGRYNKSANTISVAKQGNNLGVSVSFSGEDCKQPCLNGLLVSAGNKRYSGWLSSADSSNGKLLVVLSFHDDGLDLLFPQGSGDRFTKACDPTGVYNK